MTNDLHIRAAVITRLAEKYPAGNFGRTAVMKLCYFLQTLRNVPLGYRFSLYSYGPFDSDVLSDLDYTEAVGGISSEVVHFPSGAYGYRITPANGAQSVEVAAREFLQKHSAAIDWVIQEFGDLGSAELELASTIIFVDREVVRRGFHQGAQDLVRRVHELKPHFSEPQIERLSEGLSRKGLLDSLH